MTTIRFWFIRRLAGSRQVILNSRIMGSLILDQPGASLVCNNLVMQPGGVAGIDRDESP